MFLRRFVVLLGLAVMLGACAYEGGGLDNPAYRKAFWFDFLDGGDLRRDCRPGSTERYRFVYNGIYQEQIRIYELSETAVGANLDMRVIGPGNLAELQVSESADLLSPWRGKTARLVLRAQDRQLLRRAMASAGVFVGPPVGLRLESDEFYWTVAACAEGRFHFSAYRWPSEAFDKAAFAPLLFGWDQTGEKINPPRKAASHELYGGSAVPPESAVRFQLRVGPNGLK